MIHLVNGTTGQLPHEHNKAICTIVVGEVYTAIWKFLAADGWMRYAERCGYDLIIINEPLDNTELGKSRSIAWQKLLILTQPWSQNYERIVWVDADILISDKAIDIVGCTKDPSKIALADAQLSASEWHIYLERLHQTEIHPFDIDAFSGKQNKSHFDADNFEAAENEPIYNTGVFVASPQNHADLFMDVYNMNGDSRLYEQVFLSIAIYRNNFQEMISPRFNWNIHQLFLLRFGSLTIVPPKEEFLSFVRNELDCSYFLHFPGSMPMLRLLAEWKLADGTTL